jgi:serine/threonine protein kinase
MADKTNTQICPGCFAEAPPASKCPQCGYNPDSAPYSQALEPGTMLNGHFVIGKVLGKPGGFGITYLAWDNTLETRVAIKEFLPSELAGRDHNHLTVVPHSREEQTVFQSGLQSFLMEARTLARFSHPNIVRVRHYFQENGTAYMVMDYYQGQSLGEQMEQRKTPYSEAEALNIILPILEGLREIHSQGFVHRDIKPQNIYLTRDGRPILLDFGAARNAISAKSRSLSVVWTPGFAPFEQYQSRGKQGPWTDVYGVAATLYFMLTGEVPPDAMDRKAGESALSLSGLTPRLGAAIRKGLAIEREQRPQTIQEFRDMLTTTDYSHSKTKPARKAVVKSSPGGSIPPQPESQTGLTVALYAGIFAALFFISKAVLMESSESASETQAMLIALVISGLFTLFYWLISYIMYRIGRKFSIGSMPGFTIPIYNSVLLCRCGGLSGWLVLLLFVPYIGGLVFPVWLYGAIAKRLGKNFWLYGLGSLLFIPVLILAFDDSRPEDDIIEDNNYGIPSNVTVYQPPSLPQQVVLHFLSGDFAGEQIPVPPEGIIIGRNPVAANIVFADSSISGEHLRIVSLPGRGGKLIEDLGSTNGTYFSFTAPPTQWQPIAGELREAEGRPVWIRIADDGPTIKIV